MSVDGCSGENCEGLMHVSEAAASVLDTRLQLHIVPKTELVSLSSPVGNSREDLSNGSYDTGILLRLDGPKRRQKGETIARKDRKHAMFYAWVSRYVPGV